MTHLYVKDHIMSDVEIAINYDELIEEIKFLLKLKTIEPTPELLNQIAQIVFHDNLPSGKRYKPNNLLYNKEESIQKIKSIIDNNF